MSELSLPSESAGTSGVEPYDAVADTIDGARVELCIPPALLPEQTMRLSVGRLVAALETQFDGLTVAPDGGTLRLHYPPGDALTIVQPVNPREGNWPPSSVVLTDMSRGYGYRQREYGVRQRLVVDMVRVAIVGSSTQHNLAMPPTPSAQPKRPENVMHWATIVGSSNVIGIEDYKRRTGQR